MLRGYSELITSHPLMLEFTEGVSRTLHSRNAEHQKAEKSVYTICLTGPIGASVVLIAVSLSMQGFGQAERPCLNFLSALIFDDNHLAPMARIM